MKSEWRVTAQFISRDEPKVYQVYRLLDVDATDQSGNREYLGGIYSTEEKAETVAKMSNGQIPFAGVPEKDELKDLRARYPRGTRVVLIYMDDPQAPPAGTVGTVIDVADNGEIYVSWDNIWNNGSLMHLIPGHDTIWTVGGGKMIEVIDSFPEDYREFIEDYSFDDNTYGNDKLMYVFRVEQMIEHYFVGKNKQTITWHDAKKERPKEGTYLLLYRYGENGPEDMITAEYHDGVWDIAEQLGMDLYILYYAEVPWPTKHLTKAEEDICKALGAKWVSMDDEDDGVQLWESRPEKNGGGFTSDEGYIGDIMRERFPSIQEGDCIEVRDE